MGEEQERSALRAEPNTNFCGLGAGLGGGATKSRRHLPYFNAFISSLESAVREIAPCSVRSAFRGFRPTYIQIPTAPLTSCVIPGKTRRFTSLILFSHGGRGL